MLFRGMPPCAGLLFCGDRRRQTFGLLMRRDLACRAPNPACRRFACIIKTLFVLLLAATFSSGARAQTVQLPFFGDVYAIRIPAGLADADAHLPTTLPGLHAYWDAAAKRLSQLDTPAMAAQLSAIATAHHLDGVGTAMLVEAFAYAALPPARKALRVALQYHILHQMGYAVHVNYNGGGAWLFGKCALPFVEVSTDVVDGQAHYWLHGAGQPARGTIFSWPQQERLAATGKAFVLNNLPVLGGAVVVRNYPFMFGGAAYVLDAPTQPVLVDYLNQVPALEPSAAFLQPGLQGKAVHRIATQLKALAATLRLDTPGTLNLLLAFTQSLPYKTDQRYYGHEQAFYPEQTLTAPFSDCEDRAMLYAALAKAVAGLPSIVLHYPDHANVAVGYVAPQAKNTVKLGRRTYMVCEPTWPGRQIGEELPQIGKGKNAVVLVD